MKKIYQAPVSLFLVLATLSCRVNAPSAGSCVKGGVVGTGNVTSTTSSRLGGYLYVGDKRCTALFEVSKSQQGDYTVSAWTAKHCLGVFETVASADLAVSFYVDSTWDPTVSVPGYTPQLKIEEDFTARRNKAIAEAGALSADHAKVMGYAFSAFSNFAGTAMSTNCSYIRPLTSDAPANPDHILCASFTDIGFYQFKIPSVELPDDVGFLLNAAASRAQGSDAEWHNRAQGLNAAQKADIKSKLDSWKRLVRESWRHKREETAAYIVDWKYSCEHNVDQGIRIGVSTVSPSIFTNPDNLDSSANSGSPSIFTSSTYGRVDTSTRVQSFGVAVDESFYDALDGFNASVICAKGTDQATYNKFLAIAEKYLIEEGKTIFARAREEQGANPTGPTYATFKQQKIIEIKTALRNKWQEISQFALRNIADMSVYTNLEAPVEGGRPGEKQLRYRVASAAQMASTPSAIKVQHQTDGVEYRIPRNQLLMDFATGDSGTIFALYGVFPVLMLNGVDGAPSSGSAAAVRLPQRKTVATNAQRDQGTSTSANNQKSQTQVASRTDANADPERAKAECQ